MRLIAIIGPYRAETAWQRELNIQAARRLGAQVAQLGAMPVIPHANTAHMDGLMPDDFWLMGTREMVSRCDAAVLVEGWQHSEGSQGEIAAMESYGKPVFLSLQALHDWLKGADYPCGPVPHQRRRSLRHERRENDELR